MRKTTMTVAAFMAVAASYAAEIPTNAGVEVKVAKGATTSEVTLTLQKGTYEIRSDKGTVAVDGDATFAGTLAVDAKKDYKITVTLPAAATEEVKVILTVTPTTPKWKTWLEKQQNAINALTTEASALGQINETDLGWRTGYLERVSTLQGDKNKFGIDEYNEWLEKGTVEALSGLSALEVEIHDATKNHTAYLDALKAYTEAKKSGGELDVSKMTSVYNGLSDKSAYTETYNSIKKEIDGLEDNAKKSYLERNAASNYDATKLAAEISGLKGRIDALTKAMQSGSTQLKNYADVLNRVEAAIANYNKVANDLYSQLVASTIPVGYGADIYTDKYQAAMKSLNEVLGKIYAVKKVNDAAKEAYDAETDINKKPEIPALPSTWAADDYETELKAVYSKVIAEVGTKVNPATGTLRAAYKVLATQISDLRKSLNDFKDAKKDEDTDKNGKVIGTWFTGKVSEIEGKIGALETDINNANKAHTVLSFDINAKGKSEIDSRKTELDARLTEYNKYVVSRNSISTLEKSTYKTAKDKVNTYKYKAYVAAERFSMAPIDKAIAEVKADARKNYQVDANDYTYGGTVTSTISTITGKINAWEASAKNAHDKYKEIYDDIAKYDLEIKGQEEKKDEAGNVIAHFIQSWASAVTNENVVIGGVATGTTYGQKKSEQDAIKETALKALTEAMAVDKAKEEDFVSKLGVAHAKHTDVEGATGVIQTLKGSFTDDESNWQLETNYQAAKDAVAESRRIIGVYKTNLDAITDYNAGNCGTKAAEKLDADKVTLGADITKIESLISKVEDLIPSTSASFDKETAAKAIAQINDIRDKSAAVKKGIESLNENIKSATQNFKDVNDALIAIGYQINGRAAAENIAKIESIAELLSPSTVNFATEISDLNSQCNAIKIALNAAPVVADARKDTPKTESTPLVKGLDTQVKELGEAVEDIRTKATNESLNEKNKQAWDAFLTNPYNKESAVSAQAIINQVIADIKKTNPDEVESAGEEHFLKEVSGQQNAYNKILAEATSAYGTKLKDGKYTDPDKNLTDAKLVELKKRVKDLLGEIATYPDLSTENEEAKAAQDKKWKELSAEYEAIRVEISASTPSGANFEEAYNNALTKLTEINNDLTKYATEQKTAYGKGECETFDPKLTLPKLTKIAKELINLKNWNKEDYAQAVAADNQARYDAFLSAAESLKETYYGKTIGTTHTDGAIDIVTKLSKLSYANKVDPELVKKYLEGEDGLYADANKIEELIANAEESYGKTVAPTFFDIKQEFKTTAESMESDIVAKRDAYAAEVNKVAKDTYNANIGAVESSVTSAISDVISVELAANDTEAKKLLNVEKSKKVLDENYKGKGAIDIYKDALESYNHGTPAVDFAYRLDKEFLPGFAEVDALLNESKELAAQNAWTELLAAVNTNDDREAMKGFHWFIGWQNATLEDLENFHEGDYLTYSENFGFNNLPTKVAFDEYADKKKEYGKYYVETRTNGDKSETHTKEYWEAYDSDVQYKTLKAANEALQNEIDRLDRLYDIAESGIRDLVIEHDELLVSNLETIKGDIEDLVAVSNTIETDIDNLNSIAIHKELQALNIEMNNMKKYLEDNLRGKDSDEWKKVDALQKENEDIHNRFAVGVGEHRVKESAEKTYASYRALEKEIGALKTSFDTTVAGDEADVNAAFAALQTEKAKLDNLFNGMFQQTRDAYQTAYDAIAPQIDAIKEKIDKQGTAVSIEKANNLKSIDNATKAIYDLTEDLTAYNKGYEDNAQFVGEQKALLDQYKADLDKVVAEGKALKNKKTDEDKLYVDTQSEKIERIRELAMERLEDLEDLVRNANYSNFKSQAKQCVTAFNESISDLKVTVLTYDVNTEANNVSDEIIRVNKKFTETIPEKAHLYETLKAQIDTQKTAEIDADTYKNHVLWSWYDEEEKKWQSALGIVEHHDKVMANYKAILDELKKIEDSIKTPGAIDDGKEVTAKDLSSMVGLTLKNVWTEDELIVADINGDNQIDVADLVMVRNFFLYGKYDGLASTANKVAARTPQTAGTMALAVQKASLGVSLDSEINYSAVQMDVTLPAGLILTDATFSGAGEVNAEFNKIGDHTWRVVVYAADGESVNVNADLVKLGMAGAGNGQIVIDNVKGANARGMLISIKGVAGDYSGATGINATMAQAKAYFYGVDGTVRKGISKGITIVKEAGNKVKKVLTK